MDVHLAVAASADVGVDIRSGYAKHFSGFLRNVGVGMSPSADVAVVVVLTGGAEPEVLAESRQYNIIIAWPQYNSLPSALEAAAALRDMGKYVRVVRAKSPGSDVSYQLLKSLRLVQLIKSGVPKFGVVGSPNRWLVSSNLGLVITDYVPLEDTLRAVDPLEGLEDAQELLARAESSDFGAAKLAPITAYSRRLFALARSRGWDGLTLGCWCFDRGAVAKIGWTPCIAVALLNQMGIPASCEGDLRALYSIYVLSKLTGAPAWMGNVNWVEGDVVILTHDGAPPIMSERYRITKRMITSAPAAIQAEISPGRPATLMRVSADLKRALLLRAVTAKAERIEACSTQVAFKVLNGAAESVIKASLGNHLAFVLDDVYEEAREYLEYIGAKVVP
ncbi:MAG: fucose isomerase [Thermoproteus sp.]